MTRSLDRPLSPTPHARGESALRHLLVGVDGSDAAGAAASFAIWLAGTADSHVTLLHACPDLPLAEPRCPRRKCGCPSGGLDATLVLVAAYETSTALAPS